MKIDVKRLRKLTEAAEELGYRVIHIHADIIKNPPHPYVKLALEERAVPEKKRKK